MSYKYGILFLIMLLIAVFMAGCASSSTVDTVPAWTPSSTVKPVVATPVESLSTPITQLSTTASIVKENPDKTTMGEKNAALKAKSYLRSMAFSQKGLIDQLEYEGFTNEQAVYGAHAAGY